MSGAFCCIAMATIKLKNSQVKGKVPLAADLDVGGELAVNHHADDPGIFLKDTAGIVRKIAGVGSTSTPNASTTVHGVVQLADAAAVTAGTAGRVVDAAQLKVELDKKANQATTYTKAETNGLLAAKAPLASPALTGAPTAPTAAAGTNTTQVATTAFVHAADKWTRTGTTLSPATAGDTIKGQLVPTNGALGSRNVIINGMVNINQRGVTIAAAAAGAYGPDRWKKVDAGNMTQIIEDVNVVHGAKYTLSWKGGTPQVLTAPASGHWTLPNIPITATEIQLEIGEVATPFERRSIGMELPICQRYLAAWHGMAQGSDAPMSYVTPGVNTGSSFRASPYLIDFPVEMRAVPSVTPALGLVRSFGGGPGLLSVDVRINNQRAAIMPYFTDGNPAPNIMTLSSQDYLFSAEL